MAEKRAKPFNHYGTNCGQPSYKKQKPDNSSSYNNSNPYPGARNGASSYTFTPNNKKAREQAEQLLDRMSRLPEPTRCQPCNLAASEMQTGLVALLDKLVAEEVVTGDEKVVHHARELHRLLSARAKASLPSRAQRDLDRKRPSTERNPPIPVYVADKIKSAADLPPLPPIAEPYYSDAVFTHLSLTHDLRTRGLDPGDNYERLEFLGDAYIEVIASRILYSRFPTLDVPQQSHLREQLVKNETLGKFSDAYALGDRLKHGGHLDKGKAWDKIIADVFEAYVAAIVLSDKKQGFQTAESWLTELWAPQLLAFKERMVENPKAREDLQKLVVGKGIKLEYKEERPMEMHNGVQCYYIGVYLTGWGFESEWLGSAQGQNKSQACVEAANDAIGRSEEVGVIPVANKKKLEMYPPKPKVEVPASDTTSQPDENGKDKVTEDGKEVSGERRRPKKTHSDKNTDKFVPGEAADDSVAKKPNKEKKRHH